MVPLMRRLLRARPKHDFLGPSYHESIWAYAPEKGDKYADVSLFILVVKSRTGVVIEEIEVDQGMSAAPALQSDKGLAPKQRSIHLILWPASYLGTVSSRL